MKTRLFVLLVLGLALGLPAPAQACAICGESGIAIWPILLGFFGFIGLGLGCLLAYMFIFTNKDNVETPAQDMLDSEFYYGVRQ